MIIWKELSEINKLFVLPLYNGSYILSSTSLYLLNGCNPTILFTSSLLSSKTSMVGKLLILYWRATLILLSLISISSVALYPILSNAVDNFLQVGQYVDQRPSLFLYIFRKTYQGLMLVGFSCTLDILPWIPIFQLEIILLQFYSY